MTADDKQSVIIKIYSVFKKSDLVLNIYHIYKYICTNLKSKFSIWYIQCGNIRQIDKLCIMVVFQKCNCRDNPIRSYMQFQLVTSNQLYLLYILWQTITNVMTKAYQLFNINMTWFAYSSCNNIRIR